MFPVNAFSVFLNLALSRYFQDYLDEKLSISEILMGQITVEYFLRHFSCDLDSRGRLNFHSISAVLCHSLILFANTLQV